jgi:hypothetical protein
MKLGYRTNLGEAPNLFLDLERQQAFATAVALTRTARLVADKLRADMPQVFDRPTPYTLNALRVRPATRESLTAYVDFRDSAGKGIAADRYLGPQVFGGGRSRKRSEVALSRSGLLPGKYTVPGAGAELDQYGNVSRGFTVKLLSYLQAFGEQGYRANAAARTISRVAGVRTSAEGYKQIGGKVYFVSKGQGSQVRGRPQHLPAGVWQKSGTHGVDVKPVLLFVDAPHYTPRLDFFGTAEEVFGEHFAPEFSTALDAALGSAR